MNKFGLSISYFMIHIDVNENKTRNPIFKNNLQLIKFQTYFHFFCFNNSLRIIKDDEKHFYLCCNYYYDRLIFLSDNNLTTVITA
jgi:hypothetical protein